MGIENRIGSYRREKAAKVAVTAGALTATCAGVLIVREVLIRRKTEELRLESIAQSAGDGGFLLAQEVFNQSNILLTQKH